MTNCPNLKAKYNYMYTKEKNIKLNNSNKPDCYSDIVKTMASADLKNALRHVTEAGLSQEEIRNIVNEYFGQRRLNS